MMCVTVELKGIPCRGSVRHGRKKWRNFTIARRAAACRAGRSGGWRKGRTNREIDADIGFEAR
jgi:hypothetical protein